MVTVLTAFAAVFLAELGDKTQLATLGFAARHGATKVFIAVALSSVIAQGLIVAAGGLLGEVMDGPAISIIAALLFFAFAIGTLRDRTPLDTEDAPRPQRGSNSPASIRLIASMAGAMLLAEIGDKSMLATLALSVRADPVLVWLGASAGMIAAAAVAIAIGRTVAAKIDGRIVQRVTAALFAVFGVALLAEPFLR